MFSDYLKLKANVQESAMQNRVKELENMLQVEIVEKDSIINLNQNALMQKKAAEDKANQLESRVRLLEQ